MGQSRRRVLEIDRVVIVRRRCRAVRARHRIAARPAWARVECRLSQPRAVRGFPDRPPVKVDDVTVGVSYEPLRRLRPLLGDAFQFSLLLDPSCVADDEEEFELIEVAARADVPGAVDRVVEIVLGIGVAFAEEHANLDGLLGELADEDDPEFVDVRVPALLAAAGRFDEAGEALDNANPDGSGWLARNHARTALQLRRWIDSGGDQALLPANPPPSRFASRERPSLGEIRAHTQARRAAVDAVRRAGRGRDRAELRSMLESELRQRGVHESPLWVEQSLDHLEDPPDRRRDTVEGLKLFGRIGLGIAKAVRNRELPDLTPPAWLDPPDRAVYEFPSDHWIEVSLDPAADPWLDRVHNATSSILDIAMLEARLRWDPEPREKRLPPCSQPRRATSRDPDRRCRQHVRRRDGRRRVPRRVAIHTRTPRQAKPRPSLRARDRRPTRSDEPIRAALTRAEHEPLAFRSQRQRSAVAQPSRFSPMAQISDGRKSFVHKPGPWRPMRYEGDYRNGLREGLWRVTDAETGVARWETTWSGGTWHGPTRSWYRNGQLEHEGEYAHGQMTGPWTFWFETGLVAAIGNYRHDRKLGHWRYWHKDGQAMSYEEWEHEYHDYDWAYDDYTGFPRGENWPKPPS